MACKLHELTDLELQKQLEEARAETRELRFDFALVRSLQNPARPGKVKRNIAKILTIQKERKLGITGIKSKKGKKEALKISKTEIKSRNKKDK